ncbi:zinc finger protein 658B-like [Calliphora vicina]|uniref:zinc finger protein 658B-like n=1 Tax=Calliphora vicina TaxID=7373 RepID=UPI00325AC7FA
MSAVAIMDVNNICRVCLRCELDMKFIFERQENPTIAQMLSELTIYKIQHFNELPHLICSDCLSLVISAYRLKEKCEKSHRTLIGMLDNQQNGLSANVTCASFTKDTLEKGTQTQTEDTFMYHCEYCDETFITAHALKLHRQNKHIDSSITCRFCSRSFERMDDLKTHISVFHPQSGYKYYNECRICKRQFIKKAHLKQHIENMHKFLEVEIKSPKDRQVDINEDVLLISEESNTTKISSEISEDEKEMFNLFDLENFGHLADDEDEIPLNLLIESTATTQIIEDVLNKSFDENTETSEDSQNSIEIEENNSTDDNLLPTKQGRANPPKKCTSKQKLFDKDSTHNFSKNFTNTIQKRKQIGGRHSKKPLRCKYCSKYFETNLVLQQHITEDHAQGKQRLSCKICSMNFSYKKALNNHFSNYHKDSEQTNTKDMDKLFYCTKCEKNFSTKNSLQRHTENHDRKRFVCKECLQDFSSKEELNSHAKAEGHDKPLLCPECGLRCKSSNILTVHLRRHNGEKPFKCKFCSKGFPRIDDLKIHEKYHTGEKSHFCETCGKGFFRKYNLRIHLRVHTGEKPHKCPHCPQAFAQSNDLKAHIRRHTGERFRCEICNAAFLQGYQIRQHKLQEHGIQETPPTQRVKKFTSLEEQKEQIKQNLQKELV